MSNTIRVLTLNVWGLPFSIARDKASRIEAIGEAIVTSNADIVCLQELWVKHDFNRLKAIVNDSHPFRHYFHSGLNGSGLCIFSKWPIEDTFYYQFPMNGLFYMIHHGDWFGGKGVGFALINVDGIIIHVYNTHLHADYSVDSADYYFVHRLTQALDTGNFIKHTSSNADVCILAGDLNIVPDDDCTVLIRGLAELEDAWQNAQVREPIPETNDCKRNTYRDVKLPNNFPGRRIDYILYKIPPKFITTVSKCIFPFDDRIPGTLISYSDHEAVYAELLFTEKDKAQKEDVNKREETETYCSTGKLDLVAILEKSLQICRKETGQVKKSIHISCFSILFLLSTMFIMPFIILDHFVIKVSYVLIAVTVCFHFALMASKWQNISWLKNSKKRLKLNLINMKFYNSEGKKIS